MADRIVACIGTKKGLFVAESSATRKRFQLRGPFGPGAPVFSALINARRSIQIRLFLKKVLSNARES